MRSLVNDLNGWLLNVTMTQKLVKKKLLALSPSGHRYKHRVFVNQVTNQQALAGPKAILRWNCPGALYETRHYKCVGDAAPEDAQYLDTFVSYYAVANYRIAAIPTAERTFDNSAELCSLARSAPRSKTDSMYPGSSMSWL